MDISIKPVSTDDLPVLSELAAAINRQHFPDILGAEAVEEIIREYLSPEGLAQMMDQGIVFHLALADGLPAGYCAHKLEDDCFFIDKFYVKQEFRRLGIGRKMFDHMLTFRAGRRTIRLTVNQGSKTAQEVYGHMGFRHVETIPGLNGPAWDLHLLEKILEE